MAAKKPTVKAVNKQLEVWRREMPSVYKDIELMAKEAGVLTSHGLSTSKRKAAAVEKFKEQFKTRYGAFGKFEKTQKEKYKNMPKVNNDGKRVNWKYWHEKYKEYNELLDEFFNMFSDGNGGEESARANEEFEYLESLDVETAIERLKEEIERKTILPPIMEYKSHYGDFETPF